MELVASPDEQHVALFIFSGQSSQGYDLFALEPTLARISGLPEAHGHGDPPVFSPDGRWLAALVDVERRVRSGPGTAHSAAEGGAYFEELQDEYSDQRVVVDWARLHVQRVSNPGIDSVTISVEFPLSTEVDEVLEWNTYDAMRFVADDVVELRLPWGEPLEVTLPPAGSRRRRLPLTAHRPPREAPLEIGQRLRVVARGLDPLQRPGRQRVEVGLQHVRPGRLAPSPGARSARPLRG